MYKNNEILNAIVKEFSQLQEVEAILLAGSHTTDTQDENSDYDLYIYSNKEVPIKKREKIIKQYCDYMEINNRFWETEDDGILRDGNIPIEIIYRDFDWIDGQLERTLYKFQADVEYCRKNEPLVQTFEPPNAEDKATKCGIREPYVLPK